MRFASFRGKSHFSLKSVIGEPDPLYYPLVPDIKIKPSGSNQNSILDVNAMIPVCYTKTSDDENFIMMGNEKCDLFQPVITDMGVCNSFNPSPTLDLLNPSFFTESFSKAFVEDLKMNESLKYGEEAGQSLNFFLVTSSKIPRQDHLMVKFGSEEPSKFYLTISTHNEYFGTKISSIAIKAGYKTSIYVEPMEIVGSEDLRSVPINKRKCRFYDEIGDVQLFKNYSQSACKFEKSMKKIYDVCKCTPWFVPITSGSDYTICDVYGMACVDAMRVKFSQNEECVPICNQVQFTIQQVMEKIDVDSTCNKGSFWKIIPQNIHNIRDLPLVFMLQKINEWKTKQTNDTFDKIRAQLEFCKYMIDFNMAEVQVKFGTKKYIKTVMGLRVSFTDKLGVFGK